MIVRQPRPLSPFTRAIPQGAVVDSFGDHRIAMAFSITGLVSPGIGILDADCVFKTCPEFFDLLARLY